MDRDESVEPHRREYDESRHSNKGNGEPEPLYQHLAAVTRGVSRHTIDTKWEPLSASAIDQISQLLNDVERSVAMRLQDEHKRTQASTAVQMVSRRLHRKLTRGQPFPPSTRLLPEEDFDFEKILDSSRALEARLTPLLHSIELLKAETAKEEALLEADAATLEALEANAKSEASRRRRSEKTLHDILRDDNKDTVESLVESSSLVHRKSQQRSLEVGSKTTSQQPGNTLINYRLPKLMRTSVQSLINSTITWKVYKVILIRQKVWPRQWTEVGQRCKMFSSSISGGHGVTRQFSDEAGIGWDRLG